jgi:hypothetical protein
MRTMPRLALAIPAILWMAPLPATAAEEWKPLFNGKDLVGWKAIDGPPGAWKADNGFLVCQGDGGGWLSTTETYGDFELQLEFRVPPGGNSGVFLRAPHEGNPAYTGLEIQILDDAAQQYANLRPTQYTGSLYDVAAASPRVTKPAGQWQTMNIVCHGREVKVALNGTLVLRANLDDYKDKVGEHPGLARGEGYIGLQNHGSRLEYRNVRLRKLR